MSRLRVPVAAVALAVVTVGAAPTVARQIEPHVRDLGPEPAVMTVRAVPSYRAPAVRWGTRTPLLPTP
jgi:hypothetical protein